MKNKTELALMIVASIILLWIVAAIAWRVGYMQASADITRALELNEAAEAAEALRGER